MTKGDIMVNDFDEPFLSFNTVCTPGLITLDCRKNNGYFFALNSKKTDWQVFMHTKRKCCRYQHCSIL